MGGRLDRSCFVLVGRKIACSTTRGRANLNVDGSGGELLPGASISNFGTEKMSLSTESEKKGLLTGRETLTDAGGDSFSNNEKANWSSCPADAKKTTSSLEMEHNEIIHENMIDTVYLAGPEDDAEEPTTAPLSTSVPI